MSVRSLVQYLPSMKHYIIASVLVFAAGAYIGYDSPERFQFILQAQQEHLKGIADSIKQSAHPSISLFGMILLNNILALSITLFMGALFTVVPIYFLLTNGAMLGYLARTYFQQQELDIFIRGILPHGIIEIPTVVLAAAFGIKLGVLMVKAVIALPYESRRAKTRGEISAYFKSLLPLVPILLGFLLIAAVVESTLTVWLAGK